MERQGQQEEPERKEPSAAEANATPLSFHAHHRHSSAYQRPVSADSDFFPGFSWPQRTSWPYLEDSSWAQAPISARDQFITGFSSRSIHPVHFHSSSRLDSLDAGWNTTFPPPFPDAAFSPTMPPPPLQSSTPQNIIPANIIDLTEDDEPPAVNQHTSQSQSAVPRRRHNRHHNAVPRPNVVPEVIDLDGPEQSRYIPPPPFIEPDAAPGRHHQEAHRWEPDIEITGHAVHTSRPRTASSLANSGWHNVAQAGIAHHLHRLQMHRHASIRQAPSNASHRTSTSTSAPRSGPRLPSRVMRYFSGIGSQINTTTRMPVLLNYNSAAFDLSQGNGGVEFTGAHAEAAHARAPAPAVPRIDPLPAARQGFTRNPSVDDAAVPVCPNCEMELCSGDSETKRQVFAVKGCGHVYCGECALNRHKTSAARQKGKERGTNLGSNGVAAGSGTDKFVQCVVEGCTQSTRTKQSMVQIFL